MTPALQNPTPFVLLRANREALERESNKWTETLTFLSQEIGFYTKMLRFQKCVSGNEAIHRRLRSFLEEKFPIRIQRLELDLEQYQQNLKDWSESNPGILDWNYEEEHRRLSDRVEEVKVEFQLFKKAAFGHITKLYFEKATIKFI